MATLAADLACALDPVQLARRAGLEPDEWQRRVLRSPARRALLNCSRQSGKSTISSVLAVHRAVYAPGSLVLLLSPSLRQSAELFRRCMGIYRALDGQPKPDAESVLKLELPNGSRIVSLPGTESTVRGYAGVGLLIVDEASRVPDELYLSCRPMLAVSGGSLLALSTPFGKRGWWYQAWKSDEPWERYEVPASSCPRIDPAFLAEERRSMGAWWFDQEYGCAFGEAEDSVFRSSDIDAAFTTDVAPLFGRA